MPNQITASGLKIKTLTEITGDVTASMQAIYGADINVSQNSPDGQLVNIFAQAALDNLEVIVDVYNSFSIDNAYGITLDQRAALNGVERQGGTYTVTPATITTDRALTLNGLDALITDPNTQVFTVADDTGTQFYLQTTQVIIGPGSASYNFRAVAIGRIETTQNTITNQVTTVLGVTAVNNPAVASSLGVDEETDAQLKIRRLKMFQLASTGPADAVWAALMKVCSDAYVVENETGAAVGVVPAHYIWCIANDGTDADVAQAIYMKKNPGCGMYGSQSIVVARPQGNSITIKFDRAATQNLWIKFSILPRYTGAAWDTTAIKTALVAALSYRLNQAATIGDVVNAMIAITPQGFLTSMGVSTDGVNYGDSVNPTTAQYYFVPATTRVTVT